MQAYFDTPTKTTSLICSLITQLNFEVIQVNKHFFFLVNKHLLMPAMVGALLVRKNGVRGWKEESEPRPQDTCNLTEGEPGINPFALR